MLREGVPTGEDGQKATLLLADVMDTESTTSVTSLEPCSICLNDYVEGDVLCWSQNSKCQHCFHKDCAVEWLMTHEECPLCRNNYLSLDGDEDESLNDEDGSPLSILTIPSIMQRMNDTAPEDTMTLLRGMHLIYLLSQLQAMADDDETDAAAHLQGIELARIPDHQRRIQQEPTTVNDLEEGRNIRIENPTLSGQQVNYHEISTAILRVPSIMNATGTSTISTSEVGNGISEEPVELRWERGDTEAEVPPSIPPIPLASETRDSLVSSMIDVDEIGK